MMEKTNAISLLYEDADRKKSCTFKDLKFEISTKDIYNNGELHIFINIYHPKYYWYTSVVIDAHYDENLCRLMIHSSDEDFVRDVNNFFYHLKKTNPHKGCCFTNEYNYICSRNDVVEFVRCLYENFSKHNGDLNPNHC